MASKARKVLQPQYVGRFQCTGSACEDSCCVGWHVAIDKETYRIYRDCPDMELRLKMGKKVTRNRSTASDTDYAKIKLNDDGGCPFLDQDRMCSVQRKLGEQFLSVTCTTYPRISTIVNGSLEKTLTFSCPEATRLALLNPARMEFDEIEEDNYVRNFINRDPLDTEDKKVAHKPQKYFWELRIFIITLLQDRSYPIWQRLVILGFFCALLSELENGGRVHEIPQAISTYQKRVAEGMYREELQTVPNNLLIQMELLTELISQRMFAGVNHKGFMDCFAEFSSGINHTEEAMVEKLIEGYDSAYTKYYQPFMEQHEHVLENYIVNSIFKNLFPFSGEKNIFDNYAMLIIHYAMIKMLLIGISGFHKENFAIDHVLKTIQSFTKVIEHENTYLTAVFKFIKDNDLNNMPYMAALIKN